MLEYKREEVFGWNNWRTATKDGYSIWITQAPTANCQVFSIGAFDKLVEHCSEWVGADEHDDDDDDNEGGHFNTNMEEFKKEIKHLHRVVGKNQVLIDTYANSDYMAPVEELFKDCITFKQEYRNTTNRSMVMYLINLQKFVASC